MCFVQTNVEGRNCDRCRPGTFSLFAKHIEGCLECFCSGVTDTCQQANLYRTQIPMQVVDSAHGFTLTDRYVRTRCFDILPYCNHACMYNRSVRLKVLEIMIHAATSVIFWYIQKAKVM